MAVTRVQGEIQQYEEEDIVVAAGSNTTIQTINILQAARTLTITVKNSHATVAWDYFGVALRTTKNAPFVIHADQAGSFTTPVHPMESASGSPVTLAPGASVRMSFEDISSHDAVRLQASGNAAASEASIYYNFGV